MPKIRGRIGRSSSKPLCPFNVQPRNARDFAHSSERTHPSFSFSAFQSLPQTPAGVAGAKAGASASASAAGMVNGAGADHENIRDGAGIDTELVSMPFWGGGGGKGGRNSRLQHRVHL